MSRYSIETSDIAVLTPYNAQKTYIADRIEEMPALSGIKVRSITDSQGRCLCQLPLLDSL